LQLNQQLEAAQMQNELQAFATIFSLINPAICVAMFLRIEKGRPGRTQLYDATKIVFVIMMVLFFTAFFGSQILKLFGVSLDAFSVAGGAVLAWIGFSMLSGPGSTSSSTAEADQSGDAPPAIAPIILFAASPGTITGVITISVTHSRLDIPLTALVAIVSVLAITWVLMVLSARMGKSKSGGGMMQDMVTRYMGLIVIAMGIQFALTGFKSFMGDG
jgi:multiple antibiotic resistance protein